MSRRRFPAWLAILALLTHLLAMSAMGMPVDVPPAPSGPALDPHAHPVDAHGPAEGRHAGHDSAAHAGMLQCCCAGFSGLAALPFEPPRLPERRVRQVGPLPEAPASLTLPRQQWPALNPRASPLA